MIWTLLAILLWVVLGGFISYYGDLQGRRWGKKRVSWFGLRPKYTAVLITSITGAVIAALSILTVVIVLPPVRDVITRGEVAIRDNKRLNERLVRERAQAHLKLSQETARLAAQEKSLAALQSSIGPMRLQALALSSSNRELLARKKTLVERATILQSTIDNARIEIVHLRAAQTRLVADNAKVQGENQRASDSNKDLAKQNMGLSRENLEMKRTNTDLVDERQKLLNLKSDLQTQTRQLGEAVDGLKSAYNNLLDANTAERDRLKSDIARLTEERSALEKQKEALSTQIEDNGHQFADAYVTLRHSRLVARAGSELARVTIDPHTRPDRVRSELLYLLDDASRAAYRNGARRGDGAREVQIVSKQIITAAGVENADENASINALTENLMASSGPVVVVARAVNNSVEGEQALIELQPLAVKRVYSQGEKIASTVLDGKRTSDELIAALLQFLQKDVRDAALSDGMIPRIDSNTGTPEIGVSNLGELFSLTERVRRFRGPVRLTAVARADTASADPLLLDFRLERSRSK